MTSLLKRRIFSPFSSSFFHTVLVIFYIFDRYQGRVDQPFWIKVCDIKRETYRTYTGSRKTIEHLTGWLKELFAHGQSSDCVARIKLGSIHVPVRFINQVNGTIEECVVLGGFHGVLSTEDYKHRPVMSLTVLEQLQDEEPK